MSHCRTQALGPGSSVIEHLYWRYRGPGFDSQLRLNGPRQSLSPDYTYASFFSRYTCAPDAAALKVVHRTLRQLTHVPMSLLQVRTSLRGRKHVNVNDADGSRSSVNQIYVFPVSSTTLTRQTSVDRPMLTSYTTYARWKH
jgi:hypothetical protein